MKEIELSDFIEIENLAAWELVIQPILDPNGRAYFIPARDKHYFGMTLNEVKAQIIRRNTYFVGNDSQHNHALLKIVDPEIRKELLSIENEQVLLTDDTIKKLFNCKTKESYMKMLDEMIVTKSEAQIMRFRWEEFDFEDMPQWKETLLTKKLAEFIPPMTPDFRNFKYYDKDPGGYMWKY